MKFDRELVSASAAASATGSTHLHSGCDSDVTVDVELRGASELRIYSDRNTKSKQIKKTELTCREKSPDPSCCVCLQMLRQTTNPNCFSASLKQQ